MEPIRSTHQEQGFDPVIFEASHGPSLPIKGLCGVITFFAWALYMYLWLPVITLVAWTLGIRNAHTQFYAQAQENGLYVLLQVSIMGAIAAALLIGWAEYNRHRFSKQDRRHEIPLVSDDEIAVALGANEELGRLIRNAKCATLQMSSSAHPLNVLPGFVSLKNN